MSLRSKVIRLAHSDRDLRPHLLPMLRQGAKVVWDAKGTKEAVAVALTTVRKMLKGVPLEYNTDGVPQYNFGGAPDSAYIRYQIPDSGTFAGFFPSSEIAFQAAWDTDRKEYLATSFKAKHKFRNRDSVLSFLANPSKVQALVRKGLKTIDPGDAAYYLGKLTPDAVVKRALSVDHGFDTVDEWHSTEIIVELMLRTSKKVPEKLLVQWVKDHWRDLQALGKKVKMPRPARELRAYGDWDEDDDYDESDYYDDDEDSIDMHERPEPGLGWMTITNSSPSDIEDSWVEQKGRRAKVTVLVSHR